MEGKVTGRSPRRGLSYISPALGGRRLKGGWGRVTASNSFKEKRKVSWFPGSIICFCCTIAVLQNPLSSFGGRSSLLALPQSFSLNVLKLLSQSAYKKRLNGAKNIGWSFFSSRLLSIRNKTSEICIGTVHACNSSRAKVRLSLLPFGGGTESYPPPFFI